MNQPTAVYRTESTMARDKSQPYFSFPIFCLQNPDHTIWDMPPKQATQQAELIQLFAIAELALCGWPGDTQQAYHIASRHSQCHLLQDSDDIGIRYLAAQVQLETPVPFPLDDVIRLLQRRFPETARNAGRKLVRVRGDIVGDAKSGRLPWREFAYVVAVYATCTAAQKKASLATVQQLTAMAHGYGSARYMPDGLQANQPTIRTQQRTVRDLSDKGRFFAMASPSNRANYFSISMSQEYLNRYCGAIAARKRQKKTAAAQSRESVTKAAAELVAKQQNEELATRRTLQADAKAQLQELNRWREGQELKKNLGPDAMPAWQEMQRSMSPEQQQEKDYLLDGRRQRKPK